MMVYRYRCIACEHEWLARRPIEERNDPIDCPQCGSDQTRRIFRDVPFYWSKPFTGQYTRGEIARMVAPETEEEKKVWRLYG